MQLSPTFQIDLIRFVHNNEIGSRNLSPRVSTVPIRPLPSCRPSFSHPFGPRRHKGTVPPKWSLHRALRETATYHGICVVVNKLLSFQSHALKSHFLKNVCFLQDTFPTNVRQGNVSDCLILCSFTAYCFFASQAFSTEDEK